MEIAFVRTGDRYYTEVERDDGAVIRIGGPGKDFPPHDLAHYVVESELGFDRGFWGRTARGEILGKVELLEPPSRRPKPLRRAPRRQGVAVEVVIGLVMRIYRQVPDRDPAAIRSILETSLTPALRARAGLDPQVVSRMCAWLDELGKAWRATPDGGRLVLEWPPPLSRASA